MEKCGGECKANGDFRLVRRGGKDGFKKYFSPVCSYISTCVNVSSFPTKSIFNLPLLTIVNTPAIFKPYAS
jgi:hypothetical protein